MRGRSEYMTEWCMAHPWMTFWLILMAIFAIESIGITLFRCHQRARHDDQ